MFTDPEDPSGGAGQQTVAVDPADILAFATMLHGAIDENLDNVGTVPSCAIEQPQPSSEFVGRSLAGKGGGLPTSVTAAGGNYLAIMMEANAGLTAALNSYLSLLTEVVTDAQGVLLKVAKDYVGADETSADKLAKTDPNGTIVAEPYIAGQSSSAFRYQYPSDAYQQIENTLYAYEDPYAVLRGEDGWTGNGDADVKQFLYPFGIHIDATIEHYAGDWSDLNRCNGSLRRIATGLGSIGANIAQGNQDLNVTWIGTASDDSYRYFAGLSSAVLAAGETVGTAAETYLQLRSQVSQLAPDIAIWIRNVLEAGHWASLAVPSSYGFGKEAGAGIIAGLAAPAGQQLATGLTSFAGMVGIDLAVAAELVYFALEYWRTGVVPLDLAAGEFTAQSAGVINDCAAQLATHTDVLKFYTR